MSAEISSRPAQQFFDSSALSDPQFYSHGVSIHPQSQLVFTSGQLGSRKDGSFPEAYRDEVYQAFENLAAVLKAGGADIRNLSKLTWYCVDWNFEEANSLFEPLMEFLTTTYGFRSRPITTLVPVQKLAFPGARFEVDAMASIEGPTQLPSDNVGRIERPVAPIKTDVVIVGGSFSGLQAANDLYKVGLQPLVLEARTRIGGRSHTIPLASGKGQVELGAAFINKTTQPMVYALTQKFGLDLIPQYHSGETILQHKGQTWKVAGTDIPGPPNPEDSDVPAVIEALEKEMSRVDINNTGLFPASSDMSFEEWLQSKGFSEFSQEFMGLMSRALVGREPREIGLHYFADYIKSGGGVESLFSVDERGAQSTRIKQGTSAIAAGLADSLKPGSVLVNSPVVKIDQHPSSSTVYTRNGLVVQCSKVILAIPTNVYGNIHFTPPLPPVKRAILDRTKPGIYTKCIVTYRTPWWKENNLTGSIYTTGGPVCFSFENSDDEASNYSLALFVVGDSAIEWHRLSKLGREEAIITHLAEVVGPDISHLARDVLEINYTEWQEEPWLEGAPTGTMAPGDLSKYGEALREPFGNIYIAGGDTAREWKGYMEGALRAGSRAADEVMKSLK